MRPTSRRPSRACRRRSSGDVTEVRWRIEDSGGVRIARCAAIESVRGVAHAFSTRVAFGRDDFDLGQAEVGGCAGAARVAAFLSAAGLGHSRPALLRQVHGGTIVDASNDSASAPAADGTIRTMRIDPHLPIPAVRTADCVPILVVDRGATAVAALHAGWRGVAAGIGTNAIERFATAGIDANGLVIALGPAILGCCYEVGEDVVTALRGVCGEPSDYVAQGPGGVPRVDLHSAIRAQLLAAGVPKASIHSAPWCTRCRGDLFFSFRAEGSGAGRLMAAVGPAGGP